MARRIIAIIPARSGSKGIPNKNMAKVAGHPLVEWALEAALGVCNPIIVSSDSDLILEFSENWPTVWDSDRLHTLVIGHKRSEVLATDSTPDLPVVQDAYSACTPEPDDVIVLLRPTSPFRTPEEIRAVAELVNPMWCDSVRSVVRAKEHPAKSYRQAGVVGMPNNGPMYPVLEPWSRDYHRPNHPRQYLPKVWKACGMIDAIRGEVVRGGSLEGDAILGWPAPEERACDIDTEEQLTAADQLARARGWKPGEVA